MSWLDQLFSKAYTALQIAGVPLPAENAINFASGFTAVDNPASGRTDISFSGASSTGTIPTSAAGTSTATLATLALGEVYTVDVIVSVNRSSPGTSTVAAWKLQGLYVCSAGPAAALSGSITTTAFGGGTGLFTAPTITVSGASVLLQVTSPDTNSRVWTWEAHIVKAASMGGGGAPAPSVATISPGIGFSLTNQTTVSHLQTIDGTDFVSGATVKIGTVDATNVTFVSPTRITCYVGTLGSTGQKDVVVKNPDNQTGTLTNGYRALQTKNWYRADDGISSISSWKDLSGNANHSTAGHASSLNTTGVGGKHAFVLVPGALDYFRFPSAFNSANSTVYIVGQFTTGTTGNEGVFVLLGSGATNDSANTNSSVVFRGDPSGLTLTDFRNFGALSTMAGPGTGVDFAMWSEHDGTNAKLKVNGTTGSTVANTGAMNVAELLIGCRYVSSAPGIYLPARIAEVIVFGGSNPSGAEDTAIRAYLNARYGTTL